MNGMGRFVCSPALHGYQNDAVRGVLEKFETYPSTLIIMPTGSGKSRTFIDVAIREVNAGGRVLILAHLDELIGQIKRGFEAFRELDLGGSPLPLLKPSGQPLTIGVEASKQRVSRVVLPDVVIASPPSLHDGRLPDFGSDAFTLVICDEAHHAVAPSWSAIFDHFGNAKRLGVTATARRMDGVGLGRIFESIAYEMTLGEAMARGFIARIRQFRVKANFDLSQVETEGGDLSKEQLDIVLRAQEVVRKVVGTTIKRAGKRKTIIFANSVAHARELAELIEVHGKKAGYISGEMGKKQRKKILAMFASGEIQFLANCSLLLEGFDQPDVACISMARPTESLTVYLQALGRGLRIIKEKIGPDGKVEVEGKADVIVLDFEGNAGKHRVVTADDVLEDGFSQAARDRARRHADGDDVLAALESAEGELQAEREESEERTSRIEAERTRRAVESEALALAAKFKLRVGVKDEAYEIDPIWTLGVTRKQYDATLARDPVKPTMAQLAALKKHVGIDPAQIPDLTRARASFLLGTGYNRNNQNLCRPSVIADLVRLGIDARLYTVEQAARCVDETRANGNVVPESIWEFVATLPHLPPDESEKN